MPEIKHLKTATFAGGCFWCIEESLSKLPGIAEITPGYSGGKVENPTYEEVCTGKTGHVEAVQVKYDPSVISYRELLIEFLTQLTRPTGEVSLQTGETNTGL